MKKFYLFDPSKIALLVAIIYLIIILLSINFEIKIKTNKPRAVEVQIFENEAPAVYTWDNGEC